MACSAWETRCGLGVVSWPVFWWPLAVVETKDEGYVEGVTASPCSTAKMIEKSRPMQMSGTTTTTRAPLTTDERGIRTIGIGDSETSIVPSSCALNLN